MKTSYKFGYCIIISILLLIVSNSTYAQDTIYTKDGREIAVNIINNDGSFIKYTDFNNPNGVTRSFDIDYIDFIKYQDGTIERFVVKEQQVVIPQKENTDPTMDYLKRSYERNLSIQNFGNVMWQSGLYGSGLGLLLLFITNFEGDTWHYFTIGFASLIPPGLILDWVGGVKASHYQKRINSLSLIVSPNQNNLAMKNINPQYFSYGIRITF